MNKNYKWAVVGMLWFVCFFNYADRQSIFSVFPKLKEEFGFGAVQLGLIGSAFMWVYALGAPVAGFIADRLPRKHLILGGCLFWSAITVLTGWCHRLWHFVTVRALEGLGETFYFPATMSLVSDYHDGRTRSRAFSLHQSSVYVGTIGGSWFGAWFAEHHGWRMGFYFFGGAGAILALVLYRFLREPARGAADHATYGAVGRSAIGRIVDHAADHAFDHPADHASDHAAAAVASAAIDSVARPAGSTQNDCHLIDDKLAGKGGPLSGGEPPGVGETLRMIFRKPTALLLMAAFLGANFVATIFLTWTPTFLVDKFGFKLTSAGLSGAVFIHLASALSVPLGGVLADRLARRFAGGRMLVQAFGLLAGAAFVGLVGLTSNVTTLLVAMTLFGLCKGLYDANIFASLYDVIGSRARATAAGIMNTVGWGGGALGPLAVGVATQYGRHEKAIDNMSEAIAFGAIIYLIGAALLLVAAFGFARRDVLRSSCSAA
ncbi:MAG TPA: MFS transporter [Opitutaceae bacterium]|nr:MFS transporter [Opitutaceae bacterium]